VSSLKTASIEVDLGKDQHIITSFGWVLSISALVFLSMVVYIEYRPYWTWPKLQLASPLA